jgi:deoxycytidine triphosphate deaminase
MMQPTNNSEKEEEIIGRSHGAELARKCRGMEDPFKDIPPSLLSADHIEKYIRETGMIAPFFKGGHKPRLKKASYEGRIGSKAYVFDVKNELVSVSFDSADRLRVPENSIVFVETDLDFRLPDYIGVRFNLQIRHVHRGLLLGTGPLVDPGYWGKLCIPLHNLTSEPYFIPLKEGLIWVEFTKTTSTPTEGSNALTRDGPEHWDIEKFLHKAARPFEGGNPVGIRSSISMMVVGANEKAKNASEAAIEARNASETAASKAGEAEKAAQRSEKTLQNYGLYAVLGTILTLSGISFGIFSMYRSDMNAVQQALSANSSAIAELKGAADKTQEVSNNKKAFEDMAQHLKLLETKIETLRQEGSSTEVRLPIALPPGTKPSVPTSGHSARKKSRHSHRPIGRSRI